MTFPTKYREASMTKRPPYSTAMNDCGPPAAEAIYTARAERAPPRYSSEHLFACARQLVIVHGGRKYSLRLRADGTLVYRDVAQVMAATASAGFGRIGFVMVPKEETP